MLKTMLSALLPFLIFLSNGSGHLMTEFNRNGSDKSATERKQGGQDGSNGTLEKMIVASGSVAMDLDLNRLNGSGAGESKISGLRFEVERNAFFTVLVFNNELRGPLPSSMGLISQNSASLPGKLNASHQQLMIEKLSWGGSGDLVVRDAKTGFTFFNIEGLAFDYNGSQHLLSFEMGRLVLSKEFASDLGRPSDAGVVVGQISMSATMRAIEITQVVNGQVESESMPTIASPDNGTVPGPDVIVGDLNGLAQFGNSSGTRVGLAVGTDSCNAGVVDLHWVANPSNDHPVIPQNLYRMSGGTSNDERFEQIGQSSVKHAFTALRQNLCGYGCNNVGGSNLGSGCSDPYDAGLNSGPNLGSRAWINPFTGAYPRNDSPTPNNSHGDHVHNGTSHRILTEISDLSTSQNAGATYYAESQYVTPHEYVWCVANPGQCNMNNNVSYRRYNVTGTGSPFGFSAVGATVRMKSAVNAWPGASIVQIQPDATNDGIGAVAYKVTQTSPGVWHYEYAVYNQNLDRAIQSFGVPLGTGITITNIGFHAPPQHPGSSGDGTVGNAGFSSTPWAQTQTGSSMTWNSETLAQNPNANAIRWGTLYNFRFDSNRPPTTVNATVGFFKTGAPITVQVQGPSAVASNVIVSGRVTTAGGLGVYPGRVTLSDSMGNSRIVTTNPAGFYRFTNVAGGGMYTVTAFSKRFTFKPQTMQVNENLTDVDFVALP